MQSHTHPQMAPAPEFLEPLTDTASVAQSRAQPPDAVWPIPLERTVSYGGGTGRAPAAILAAGNELERYDEELRCYVDWNVRALPVVADSGQPIDVLLASIQSAAEQHYRSHAFVVALGGEHTLTIPLVRAAAAVFGPLGVLQIDAHADLRSQYLGEPYSHACVMYHVRTVTPHTVGVGIRSLSLPEAQLIRDEDIAIFRACDIPDTADSTWIDRVVAALPELVYVTVDVDGFDPSVFPGTGTPEPGGLSWRQGLSLLRRVFQTRRVVAADIVEAVPLPGTPLTEYAAARLALKMMVYRRCLQELTRTVKRSI